MGGTGEHRGAGEEAGVEAGAQLNRRVSPAPGKKPDVALPQRREMSLEPPHGALARGLGFFLVLAGPARAQSRAGTLQARFLAQERRFRQQRSTLREEWRTG